MNTKILWQKFILVLVAMVIFPLIVSSGLATPAQAVEQTLGNPLALNSPPQAQNDSGPGFITTKYAGFTTGNVLTNDSDPDGDRLFVDSFNTSETRGILKGDGSLDVSYGEGGKALTQFSGTDVIVAAAVLQLDGKLVVAGSVSGDFTLVRYLPDGTLDESFDSDGKVTTDFGGIDRGNGIAVQTDGKIIITGVSDNDIALARYNSDGSLDTFFGTGGKVITHFPNDDAASSGIVILPSNEKIVVAGTVGGDIATLRYDVNGNLDPTFGSNGVVIVDFGNTEVGRAIELQVDSKIVVGGSTDSSWSLAFALARINPDGSLDNTFGNNGKVITDLNAGANALAIDTDGKIVAAGDYVYGGGVVTRYYPDGNLDASFDEDGILGTFGISDVVILEDHKIIVAGMGYFENTFSNDFAIARYNVNGTPDVSFGVGGTMATDIYNNNDRAHAVAIQNDGKIVAAGEGGYNNSRIDFAVVQYTLEGMFSYNPAGQFDWLAPGEHVEDTFNYIVSDGLLTDTATVSITINGVDEPVRYPPVAADDTGIGFSTDEDTAIETGNVLENDADPDGDRLYVRDLNLAGTKGLVSVETLDASFGDGGKIWTNFGTSFEIANAVTLQPDGKIIVAGATGDNYSFADFALARYNLDGNLDETFSGGKVTLDCGADDQVHAVVVQSDGKIVATGSGGHWDYYFYIHDFCVARYNPDGTLDVSFGEEGKVMTDFGGDDIPNAMLIEPEGKIVTAGMSAGDLALARYESNGTLDTTFGNNGLVTTDLGNDEEAFAIARQNDGDYVLVGRTGWGLAMVRYTPDGNLDTSFGEGGKVITDKYTGHAVVLRPDGKILVSGTTGTNIILIQFNPDGSHDMTFGTSGMVTTRIAEGDNIGNTLALRTDGRMVVAGQAGDYFGIAAYNLDGSLDPDFNMGMPITTTFGVTSYATAITLQPDNKIIAVGRSRAYDEYPSRFVLARYDPSGTFIYDPNDQFNYLQGKQTGQDTFTYTASDGIFTDTGIVTITIDGISKAILPIIYYCPSPEITLTNGDFEAGYTGWTEFSDWGYPHLIIDDSASRGVIPHSGNWVAWVQSGYIEQTLTVPSCKAYLAMWVWVRGCSWSRCWYADITLDGTNVGQIYLGNTSTEWSKFIIDLSDYQDQTVDLRITVGSNSYDAPTLVVDDLLFQSGP